MRVARRRRRRGAHDPGGCTARSAARRRSWVWQRLPDLRRYHHLHGGLGLSSQVWSESMSRSRPAEHNAEVAEAARLERERAPSSKARSADVDVETPVDIAWRCTPATPRPTTPCLAESQWRSDAGPRRPLLPPRHPAPAASAPAPAPYELVTRHGLLRERWGDVLTDALRAHLLRRAGYRTDVVEFVDSQHTPRNVLLRAHRTGARRPHRAGGRVRRAGRRPGG